MTEILFVVPPHISFDSYIRPSPYSRIAHGRYGSPFTDMPLGVLVLSSYLKSHLPVTTRLVDFNTALSRIADFRHDSFAGFFIEQLTALHATGYRPAIIGISMLFTPSFRSAIAIAEACRSIFPEALILGGGGVATNMHAELFAATTAFDGLCHGEGELPFRRLVAAADRRALLASDPCWITAAKSRMGGAFRNEMIAELDEIPFYDLSLCDPADYEANPAITAFAGVDGRKRNFHVMFSRGCPHRCTFCSSHTVHGRQMRYYSLDRVRADLVRLRDELGARTLVMQDDHFMADRHRALAIIGLIKELGFQVVFQNSLALYALDRTMLEAIKSAGVHQLVLSVESGSGRVLREIMHKPLAPAIVRRVAHDCRELGIYTNANILIGMPGETQADIDEATAFLKELGANWFVILIATPLAGSEMLALCQEKGYLKGSYIDCDFKKPIIETEHFTAAQVQDVAYRMNLTLNFVHNSDLRRGAHATALKGFENAIRVRPDHAIAHHYAAICHEALGRAEQAAHHRALAERHGAEPFWSRWIQELDLPIGAVHA